MSAFLAAGARPKTPLARAIALVLVIKLVGLVSMKIFMFPDSTKPVVDATAVARVLGPSTSLP
ncbi:cytochrome oxidase putative small subunit CydP [Bradyrhizobium sp. UFLA05-112]